MIVLIVAIVWYVLGMMGCFAGILADISRGFDLTVRDIFIAALLSLGGPVMLVAGLNEFIKEKEFFDRVLIKGKQ